LRNGMEEGKRKGDGNTTHGVITQLCYHLLEERLITLIPEEVCDSVNEARCGPCRACVCYVPV
jgi:hypothetical protein